MHIYSDYILMKKDLKGHVTGFMQAWIEEGQSEAGDRS